MLRVWKWDVLLQTALRPFLRTPPFKRLEATQVKANPGDIVLNKLTIHRLLAVATAGSLGELMLSKLGL